MTRRVSEGMIELEIRGWGNMGLISGSVTRRVSHTYARLTGVHGILASTFHKSEPVYSNDHHIFRNVGFPGSVRLARHSIPTFTSYIAHFARVQNRSGFLEPAF
jgi:hypothetical protein